MSKLRLDVPYFPKLDALINEGKGINLTIIYGCGEEKVSSLIKKVSFRG